MKTKVYSTFCAAILAFSGISQAVPAAVHVSAAESKALVHTYQGMLYEIEDGQAIITGYTKDLPEKLVIPSKIDGVPVKTIRFEAFKDCKVLKELTISSGFLYFEGYVFENCVNLEKVTLPDTLETLDYCTFLRCTALKSISIPKNVYYVGERVFADCTNLAEISFSEKTLNFGAESFKNTAWLAAQKKKSPFVVVNQVLIDGSTTSGEVTIPENVESIAPAAFKGNTKITKVIFPYNLYSIGQEAFADCTALADFVFDENNILYYFDRNAFENTAWIKAQREKSPLVTINHTLLDGKAAKGKVTVPEGITIINEYAFEGNQDITEITLPDSLAWIGFAAFEGCALKEITIPEYTTDIVSCAFHAIPSLTAVKVMNPNCAINSEKYTISNGYDEGRADEFFNGTIYGYEGSGAQVYAKKWGYKFESLGALPNGMRLRGDYNGDAKVGLEDAQSILTAYTQILAGEHLEFPADQYNSSDINMDCALDAADAQYVLLYYVMNTVSEVPIDWNDLLYPVES